MANYIASARTNFVRISDMPALVKALSAWGAIQISEGFDGKVCFLCEDGDGGGWPTAVWLTPEEAGDGPDEVEFSWEEYVMPFVAEGEVLVVMEAGAEKLRYIVGWAVAYIRQENTICMCEISLQDIYGMAATEFGVPLAAITTADY